jgi:hypothetical protein
MVYLAVLDTGDYEWICMSDTEAAAKQGVFDGYNTYLKRQFEAENIAAIETTSEYLDRRLQHFYKTHLDGPVSVETLENKFRVDTLDILKDEVYRDGYKVPRREQDY